MKTVQELASLSTREELLALHIIDLAPHVHIITDAGGNCMCGTYDGKPFTCQDILSMHSHDIQDGIIGNNLIPPQT